MIKNLLASLFQADNTKRDAFQKNNHISHYSKEMSKMIVSNLINTKEDSSVEQIVDPTLIKPATKDEEFELETQMQRLIHKNQTFYEENVKSSINNWSIGALQAVEITQKSYQLKEAMQQK